MKNITTILLLLCTFTGFGFQGDSVRINQLSERVNIIEGGQKNHQDALDNRFVVLDEKLKGDYQFLKWFSILGIGGSLLGLILLISNSRKYIQTQLNKKFDNIITEKEGDLLALIKSQSDEKQFVKNKKILVLTAQNGNDMFLRKFFRAMGFPIDNVKYIKKETYKKQKDYDLIFANNEKGDLGFPLINDYFENSKEQTVLFYFNSNRKNYNNDKIADRLSFASAKTQIYGNLINLFKYQELL